ncbi:glycoside hydrolase superfamily [Lipomyces oligophaga]|uniref:glycoside hydrolase superfamily n=1 Tax=Lipomyces oligophaga TaxID=45792 RepID=UPI0034CD5126
MTDQPIQPNQAESDRKPTDTNATLLQAFEWYIPDDHQHWKKLAQNASAYAAIGLTALWIPPPCKATGPSANGYDIYDLWDLGEFDQKGSVATKWGSKEDLLVLVEAADKNGISLYADAVLNHKAAADRTEKCTVIEVDPSDRTKQVSEPHDIEGWFGFDFPGRADKYSTFKWHWHHFTGTDYDDATKTKAIFKVLGENKTWAKSVDKENGNFDYLMFADIDHSHPEVQSDINAWGVWLTKTLHLRGMRFDAVKHFSEDYLRIFVENLQNELDSTDLFFVGEFWKDSLEDMSAYLDRLNGVKFSLFDAPLVYNFSEASQTMSYDLRKIFDGSLVAKRPVAAVTLVMNHDTQPHQALEAKIEPFFKPLAYAIILLRAQGYPCVFWGDLEGIAGGPSPEPPSCGGQLADLILARKLFAYGDQEDYFDYATCLGWVRRGTWDRPSGCAVVLSNAGEGTKHMCVGAEHAGEIWTDVLGWSKEEVTIGEDGFADFKCPATSVSIWVNKEADGRNEFGKY